MFAAKALTLASLGGAMSWVLHVLRPETHTSLAQIATKCLIMMGSPELYYVREDDIRPEPISFTEQEIVAKIDDIRKMPYITIPTVTKNLPIHLIPSPTEDDPAAYWSWGIFPEVDFSGHFVTLIEHLLMSLVLLILVVLYCTIIKPIHLFMSVFTNASPIGELLDLLDLIAEYEYATFFWLALILYYPLNFLMKSSITCVTSVGNNVNPGQELKDRLRRAEDLAQGHSILLGDLDMAKNVHTAALADLEQRMATSEARVYDFDDFVKGQAMPMVIDFVNFQVDQLASKFNVEVNTFTYRAQSLETEVKALRSEIEVLESIVSDLRKEKASLEEFYRKQTFQNRNANQTAFHMQDSPSTDTMRRGGHPVTSPPMGHPQNMTQSVPGHYPSSTCSASLGSFMFNNSPGSFNLGPPLSFTAGGGSTADGSADVSASGSPGFFPTSGLELQK